MKLFDLFSKKNEKDEVVEEHAPGWDAITEEAERIYPEQKDPKHYGTAFKWRVGGEDPLDGISIYDGEIIGVSLHMDYQNFMEKKDNYVDE